jgi:hypothetical protein
MLHLPLFTVTHPSYHPPYMITGSVVPRSTPTLSPLLLSLLNQEVSASSAYSLQNMSLALQRANTSSLLVSGLLGAPPASYPALGSLANQQTHPNILSQYANLLLAQEKASTLLSTALPISQPSAPLSVSNYKVTPADVAGLTGRKPVLLYVRQDEDRLSDYQILARKQIELFEASPEDVETSAQGRVRRLRLGQVGIRCRHCTTLPVKQRKRGAFYYPARLEGVYQTAQNMTKLHLLDSCLHIPDALKNELMRVEKKSLNGAGKKYWSTAIAYIGVDEDEECLRFRP